MTQLLYRYLIHPRIFLTDLFNIVTVQINISFPSIGICLNLLKLTDQRFQFLPLISPQFCCIVVRKPLDAFIQSLAKPKLLCSAA